MKNYLNHPLQFPGEFEQFVQLMKDNNIKSYLEIGSMYGGSLWLMSNIMPKGSRIVSVDLPSHGKPHATQSLKECMAALKNKGYDTTLIIGDSTDPNVVEQVRCYEPFDACLIDANHTLAYVTKDWENYGPMCRMVAFHDVNYLRSKEEMARIKQQTPGVNAIDVPPFWDKLKTGYRHVEIKHDKRDNGIGVLWH